MDFKVLTGMSVVAVSSGVVIYIDLALSDPGRTGAYLEIRHDVPGTTKGVVRHFTYAHLANVRVTVGDTVATGEVLGDAWRPSNQVDWVPHVHLETTGPNLDQRDPLPLLRGCVSRHGPKPFVYPVSC